MNTYQVAIKTAIVAFPVLALLITLPYMIKQYRKYGSIPFLRNLIVYSFVLYMLTAFFMVILPLPEVSEVLKMKGDFIQLKPFNFIGDIIQKSKFVFTKPNTYLIALKQPVLYTNLFNIVLTLPFGIYLRYYFKKSWKEVLMLGFCLSLFYELTQLSGLYGIYPRPYRLFDVDDLILNTLGSLLGYVITPMFSFLLPSRDKLDEMSYEKGKRVSFLRRLLAVAVDFFIYNIIIFIFFKNQVFELYNFLFLIYMIINVIIFKGYTIGKYLVNIKIVDEKGEKPKLYLLIYRYILRYIFSGEVFFIINWFVLKYPLKIEIPLTIILFVILFIIYVKTGFDILSKKEQLFYETMSRTKNINTAKEKSKTI